MDTDKPEQAPILALSPEHVEYRKSLTELEGQVQQEYDRTVIALSGGALGISFSFIKDYLGDTPATSPGLLRVAWMCWAASLLATPISYYLSPWAIRKTIQQVDAGTVGAERAGGKLDIVIVGLNGIGGLLFIVGLLVMGWFMYANVR
jgi:hypothetical protein